MLIMTIGISKEKLTDLYKTLPIKYDLFNAGKIAQTEMIIQQCKELDPWLPIEDAPKDRQIVVYAPPYQDLESIVSKCQWHEDAGFCIDELRQPTLWQDLPKDQK